MRSYSVIPYSIVDTTSISTQITATSTIATSTNATTTIPTLKSSAIIEVISPDSWLDRPFCLGYSTTFGGLIKLIGIFVLLASITIIISCFNIFLKYYNRKKELKKLKR